MPKKKILIIEDDAILISVLADNLSREGFDILKAHTGRDGFSSAMINKPDLILLDIFLPDVDGFVILKKLRENEWGKHIPVIILTNSNSLNDISKFLESKDGFQEYLVKSDWKIEDVVERVKERLKK